MTPERLAAARNFVATMTWPGCLERDSARDATDEAFRLAKIGIAAISYVNIRSGDGRDRLAAEAYWKLCESVMDYTEGEDND